MTEEIKELSRDVASMVSRREFQDNLNRIEKNQQVIYDSLNESTTGIKEEHRKMLVELLRDYKQLFDAKIRLVNLHHDELGRLTSQLKTKIKAYNVHIRALRKAVKEADTIRVFFNVQAKKLNKTIIEYNQKVTELNAKILGLQGGD